MPSLAVPPGPSLPRSHAKSLARAPKSLARARPNRSPARAQILPPRPKLTRAPESQSYLQIPCEIEAKPTQSCQSTMRKGGAAAGTGFRRRSFAPANRRWIPPSTAVSPSPATAPSRASAPAAGSPSAAPPGGSPSAPAPPGSQSPYAVPVAAYSAGGGPFGGAPSRASAPAAGSPSVASPAGFSSAAAAFSASIGAFAPGSSSFGDLLGSSDRFLSYMMEQPQKLPENSHFVGNMEHARSSPIDIEADEADEDDGDGVRTIARLTWKPEEDGRVLGMGSALETLCGQAVGAGQVDMLGVYIQRSWLVCGATAVALTPTYLLTAPILRGLRQPAAISAAAGDYARWVLPQLFAYAANFPLQKFFQAQSRVWVVTLVSGAGLAAHVALNYVVVTRLGYGLRGAAVVGNVSWWLVILAQVAYFVSGRFPEAWRGFSKLAFRNLAAFVKLSLASAIMLCLELWYYTAVLILVGLLKNAQLQVDVMSICINYQLWTLMIALGFNAAVSVRVSNELGANRPKAAKFSVVMAVSTSASIGAVFMAVFLIWRRALPRFFSDDDAVLREAAKLGYLLAGSIFLNSIQPVLSGVAIGAGWQTLVAFINIGCYYFIGIPLGALFGFKLNLDAMGIWLGMAIGTLLQTSILLFISYRTKWEKQAMMAEERIREWGGRTDALPSATQVAPAAEDADQ